MDYTKDAILIHEGLKTFHDSSSILEQNDGYIGSEKQATTAAPLFTSIIMNGSAGDISSVLQMTFNKSLSSLSLPTSPPSPIPSLSSPFDDEHLTLNESLEYIPYSMRPETYIVPVLFAIIFIIGVIGNGTLIVIFMKHRSMRNVPNMFIVSLAIGDLLVILFCVPFTSTVYTVDSWPYGLVVCKFSEFIKDLSQCVSVFTLTALSADRYFAIVDPMRKLTGRRATRITIISIVGIWMLSVLFALPSALYSYIRVFPEFEPDEGSGSGELGEETDEEMDEGRLLLVCYPYPTEFGPVYAQGMVMFHFLVYYAVPLCFIATFYIIMARHLVLSTRNMPGEAQGQGKQIQARKKVAKMILSFVVIFAICFFPHHLFLLWFYFYPDAEESFNDFWNVCRILGFCLSFANSCINPITLYCVSGTFRKQFNDHLFCCLCDQSGNPRGHGGCRQSLGGTLRIGGGSRGGLCAGCVSDNGNNGQLHADSRYGNGDNIGRCNGRLQRGSTMNSDRMTSKRKSTWDTQTTVVNHRLLNIEGPGKNANVHVNMCSEHQSIPLKNMTLQIRTSSKPASTQGVVTTDNVFNSQLYTDNHHQNKNPALIASTTSGLISSHIHWRKNSCGNTLNSNQSINSSSRRRSLSTMNNTNKVISDNHHHLDQKHLDTNFIEEETERCRSSTILCHDEQVQNNQLIFPTKSSNKVGEILCKISQKCTSPKRVSSGDSSPSKKSLMNSLIHRSSSVTSSKELNLEKNVNYNNNNNYTKTTPDSAEECEETTFIQMSESRLNSKSNPTGNDLEDVVGQLLYHEVPSRGSSADAN